LDIIPHMTEEEYVQSNRFIKGNIDTINTKQSVKKFEAPL